MTLHDILAAMHPTADSERWLAQIPEDWMQGRSAYGGLQVAIAVHALRQGLRTELPLRCVQVAFMAPIPAGDVEVEVTALRQGSSVLHAQARVLMDGQAACLVTGIFGRARESSVRIPVPQRPEARSVAESVELPYIDGVTPRFTRFVNFHWADGDLPFSGGTASHTRVWMTLRDIAHVDEAAVLALADAIPSPAIGRLKRPAPASSLTWTIDFLSDRWSEVPDRHWRIDTEVTAAADGYVSQTGSLFDPDGQAILLSRQSVVVFS